jgi:uncharacterized protein
MRNIVTTSSFKYYEYIFITMPRPRICRRVHCEPGFNYFKPRGVPMSELQTVELTVDELEAIRLNDLEGLEQTAGAEKMKVSQPTFHRILGSARKKVAEALINGKAIRIGGGDYNAVSARGSRRQGRCRGWSNPPAARPNNASVAPKTLSDQNKPGNVD